MTTLLPASDATNAAATEGDVKDFLTNLRDYMADFLGTDSTNKGAALALLGAALNGSISKTTSYTVVSADRGKVINCTGTFTINVQAAATLGDGFVFSVRNAGTGVITVDPNLSETINGQTSVVVGAGSMKLFYCDGAGFSEIGGGASAGTMIFNTAGTHSFVVPPGVSTVKVNVIGGGGGGCNSSSPLTAFSAGGGGGGRAFKTITGLISGDSIAVTVGAGGAGGSTGGTSSFGSYCSATGGSSGTNVNTARPGGTGIGGDINWEGGNGAPGGSLGAYGAGGAGGGSMLDASAFIEGDTMGGIPGRGWYGGAGGPPQGVNYNGNPASGYGNGGGGACCHISTKTGGQGSGGIVIIEW